MEGYSITEAASVLGVPTERVWELLARGVLAGAAEGETGMRVFLQPRPAPAPVEPSQRGANGGEEHRELSPFRELLTEFRSLTERYGQALLALGEARGEVAALRSRVDLLEARMDLRLPSSSAASSPAGWAGSVPSPATPPPAEPAPQPEPAAREPTQHDEARQAAESPAETPHGTEAEPRSGRRWSPARATESFAEALARADDPSVPELLAGPEATLAALRAETAVEEPAGVEASLPRELPPADDVPVADEVTVAEEPMTPRPIAAGEPESSEARTEAPEAVEAEAAGETEAEEPIEIEPAEEPMAPEPSEAEAREEPQAVEAVAPEAVEAETIEEPMTPEPVEPETVGEPMTPEPVVAEAAEEPPAWQDDRYTAEIAEPDWWEAEAGPEPPTAGPAPEAPDVPEPGPEPEPGPDTVTAEAETDLPPTGAETPAPAQPSAEPRSGLTRLRRARPARADEETVLWFGRGSEVGDAEEMEIAPTGMTAEEPRAEADQPVDALAALEALSRSTPQRVPRDVAQPERPQSMSESSPRAEPEPSSAVEPRRPPDEARPIGGVRPAAPTTAGRAYRRLRRIFPG